MALQPWRLVADIGGTNARFGAVDASGAFALVRYVGVADYTSLDAALEYFVGEAAARIDWQSRPSAACIAVAGPAERAVIRFSNSSWTIERDRLKAQLGGATLHLINDFAAVGHAVAHLRDDESMAIGGGCAESGRPLVVVGPGTGLGVCTVIPSDGGYRVLEGEGGHVDFGATTDAEYAVLTLLERQFGRVSAERVLSGAGIFNLYTALAQLGGEQPICIDPATVTAAALKGEPLAEHALQMFCALLGAFAGNLALTVGARGGVYIAGGVVPRFLPFLARSSFRQRFEQKGRLHDYLAAIPVRVALPENLGLVGALRYLEQHPPR